MFSQYSGGIFASGNPLLIMTIIDNHDGSAFDIYAKEKKIEVVPQMKASSSSLGNLVRTITDFFPDIKFNINLS